MRPFFSIWIAPRKTFEYLSNRDEGMNRETTNILSVLIAIGVGIPQLKVFSELFENHRFVGFIIGVILFGFLGVLIIKFLLALIYWGTGKILKGKANKNQIQLVVAYSLVPYLIYLIIGLILIVPALITKNMELIFYRHPFTYYVVWFFAIRNLIYGLSYFNRFSYGYALVNVLIPAVVTELIRLTITNWRS